MIDQGYLLEETYLFLDVLVKSYSTRLRSCFVMKVLVLPFEKVNFKSRIKIIYTKKLLYTIKSF